MSDKTFASIFVLNADSFYRLSIPDPILTEEDWFQVACTYDFSSGEEAVQTAIKEVLHFLSETTDLLIEIDLPF